MNMNILPITFNLFPLHNTSTLFYLLLNESILIPVLLTHIFPLTPLNFIIPHALLQ